MKPIPNFSNYFVTKDGRVWSSGGRTYTKAHWLRPTLDECGRPRVCLSEAGRIYHRRICRLVLEAFVGPCPEGMEACHNNGDPADNRLENLRWDTRSANALDAVRHGTASALGRNTRGTSNGNCKLTEQEVKDIDRKCRSGAIKKDLALQYGVTPTMITYIAKHKTWKHLWV